MRISDWSSDVCSSDLQAYSIQPTPSRIGTLNASVNALITQFGAIRDGIGSGNLPDGTAAAPALRFGADADTGLWRPSANAIAWSTAGAERMRLTTVGLGIGKIRRASGRARVCPYV